MKRSIALFLSLLMIFSLIACGKSQPAASSASSSASSAAQTSEAESSSAQTSEAESSSAQTAAFPRTVIDQAGRRVTIEKKPETIVSGYYISSSILIALGLEDQLVGIEAKAAKRPIYALAAPQLISLPNVGSAKEFDLEGCAALKPDLILLPLKLKNAAASLESLGLKVILVNPETTEDLYDDISRIAAATGADSAGNALTAAIRSLHSQLADRLKDSEMPSVYMAGSSSLLETAGAKMYQSSMIERAGGRNVAAHIEDSYWTAISYEQLLSWNPDYIILAAESSYTAADVLSDPNLSACTAVKNGHVYRMPSDIEAWDSPVPGAALGSTWLASLLHSDRVSGAYYEQAVRDFYESFYGFTK